MLILVVTLTMPDAPTIAQDDAVELVALMARVAAVEGTHLDKKRYLLKQLGELVEAERWNWALNTVSPEGIPRHAGLLHGGFTLEQAEKLSAGTHHPESMQAFASSYLNIRALGEAVEAGEPLQPFTVRLEDHPNLEDWPKTEAAQILAESGVGTFIASVCPVSASQSSSVTLFRSPGADAFTERQRDLVDILMRGVIWLHTVGWPDSLEVKRMAELPPSQTVILTLLIKGYSRQEIAETRGLSVHSVNTYVRQVFRHFGVQSQTELMRRFLHSN